ncbi:MBL fold metallo-hydrolase [Caulobacter sp. CCH9-E1]|jgi:glyoxylase-like metal-dependent hydrolase (beta-lactamase superfamily II)|uniref:MBL fold metallo-hydrolase n=1 Tax=Caulobacter sp. CCH9-E1 TaxID=1768768 RepID=UPI00082E5408|nr:MBL fold metallo-hydrolase [Caulobacter sp. CCH9-E1]
MSDPQPLSRHGAVLAIALAGLLGVQPGAATAQTPYANINKAAAAADVTLTPLRGGVYLVEGSGGNMAAIGGPEGLLLVDDGIALSKTKMRTALKRVGKGRLRYAINTHWHWDHTDGNSWARQDGAVVVAHTNTARHLEETIRVEEWGHTFTPVAADGRADVRITGTTTIAFAGDQLVLRPYAPSHTDGDLSAYFAQADILLTGDTWWNGLYPFIDYVAGGGIDGMIAAADASIAQAGPRTIVVPGHGPVGGRDDLIAYRAMLATIRDNVAKLKAQGLSVDQVIAARPTAAFDEVWGKAIISPELFTRLVYRGV